MFLVPTCTDVISLSMATPLPTMLWFVALLVCLIHPNAGDTIFSDTISDDTNFDYSGAVTFDGSYAKLPGTSTTAYVQTKAGVASTVGYTDIQIQLQFYLSNWASGSLLSIYWKANDSLNGPIASYDHDDLSQNTALTITTTSIW